MKLIKAFLLVFLFIMNNQLLIAQCSNNGHSVNAQDSWLSCQETAIPSSNELINYHWLYYDLGYNYQLGTVKIWNYNVQGETGNGIKDAEIFHSDNGQHWVSGGTFQIPEASGQASYDGWEGVDLNGVQAQFLTLVAYSNWSGDACTGLSEVRFNISGQTTAINTPILGTNEVVLFPNPTIQTLSVKLKNNQQIKELILINNAGHEVVRMKNTQASNSLDVSSFPAGMYYLKILTTEQKYLTSKFVKTE